MTTTTLEINLSLVLNQGEKYAGLILSSNAEPSYHLILLPGQAENMNWQDAIDWASSINGYLPTRQEQSLLFANLKGEFEPAGYWSTSRYSHADAWIQNFGNGYQYHNYKSAKGRARAVRRISLPHLRNQKDTPAGSGGTRTISFTF